MSDYTFIAGCTRSGSTALGSELASRTGAVHVGELHHFWRSAAENRLCGCGETFQTCHFWQEIAGPMRLEDAALQDILEDKTRLLNLPRWLANSGRRGYWGPLAEPVTSLINALSANTPAIVDSSKNPAFLDLICDRIGVPKTYVSRRPVQELRASWQKEKPDPDSPTGVMSTKSAIQVYRESAAITLGLAVVQRRHRLSSQVINASGGRFDTDLSSLGPTGAGEEHTLAGNPNRHRTEAKPESRR